MQIQLETDTPIVDGVLSCYSLEQMVNRLKDTKPIEDTTKFLCNLN